jgi:hypothetical protein
MTNLPKLDAICQAAATNMFAQSEQHTSDTPLLAPACLMPSTFNFGPSLKEKSLVDTMRAVYNYSEQA